MLKVILSIIISITGIIIGSQQNKLVKTTLIHVSIKKLPDSMIQLIFIKAEIDDSKNSLQYNLFKKFQFTHLLITHEKGQLINLPKTNSDLIIFFQNLLQHHSQEIKHQNNTQVHLNTYKFVFSGDSTDYSTKQGNFESIIYEEINNDINKKRGSFGLTGSNFDTDEFGQFRSVHPANDTPTGKLNLYLEMHKSVQTFHGGSSQIIYKPVSISVLNNEMIPVKEDETYHQINVASYNNEWQRNIVTHLSQKEAVDDVEEPNKVFNTISVVEQSLDSEDVGKKFKNAIGKFFASETSNGNNESLLNKPKTYFVHHGLWYALLSLTNEDLTEDDLQSVLDSNIFAYESNDAKLKEYGLTELVNVEKDIKRNFEDDALSTDPWMFRKPNPNQSLSAVPPQSNTSKNNRGNIGTIGKVLIVSLIILFVGLIVILGIFYLKKSGDLRKYK